MADNVKIVGNILSTTTVSRYDIEDSNLIPSKKLSENFGGKGDYIEFYIYDVAGNLLSNQYNYLNYKLPSSTGLTPGTTTSPNTTGNIQTENVGVVSTLSSTTSSLYPIIEIDPIQDLQNAGYSSGEFNVRYNLFKNIFSDYNNEALFIKEISSDRTEIRLGSISLTDAEIEQTTLALIDEINNADYYVDYLLNFGYNEQYVAVNVALNKAPEGYEILFKLYHPLPLNVQEKQTLWVVEEKTLPYVFDINLDKYITPGPAGILRGPNFDITIPNQSTISTTYNTYSGLVTGLQSLQSSSYRQILNLLATQSIDINVDYTDFNNFIFFGSAYQRVSNFYTKVKQIENYNNLINKYTPYIATTASLQFEINNYSASIDNIISQFDGFESYQYFEDPISSSSVTAYVTWPKSRTVTAFRRKPYVLLSTGSALVKTWYNNLTASAKTYDLNNYNNLEYAIPSYLKDDTNNAPFLTFLNMVGHYFDNIWIYLKSVTDINLANNNLDYGISRDLVYERLQSLGIHLYNSQAGENVDKYLIGSNTGSWSATVPVNNYTITGSYLNSIPRKDLLSELYKRIYHNLPLLLKTKGTVAGLDYLMTTFGIPNQIYYVSGSETFYTPTGSNSTGSILNVKEFGGSLKSSLISGYNNDKVRIITNTITPGTLGSILSPIQSLQTYPSASAEFRDDDMNYVDISFSPETQIDTYISKSIASNNPTWSLDNYIGNPGELYNTRYEALDAERELYFETGVTNYPGFTGSLMDYNGFIRLIQYFDNALFKMLEDFTPERTSLSTGVTITSPVLERNKTPYANPASSTTQSVQTALYSSSISISSSYDKYYYSLPGTRKQYYNGDLSGSNVNVHQYFVDNYNPYLQPSTSIDINKFAHSDWNVLLNNVSKSIDSNTRQRIEYIGNLYPSQSLLHTAELQDSYLSLRSYNISRYEGSKLTSLNYNTYTSESYTGSNGIDIQNGDISYGKTAAIDNYTRKIGLFTQVVSSSFLPDRNTVALKYLVDEFGNLTELNQLNNNWPEVQRMYKMRKKASIALFDVLKYGNQKTTNGIKSIFDSGYYYSPILYGEGKTTKYAFDNLGVSLAYLAYATNLNPSNNYYATGSPTTNFFQISQSRITNLFPNIVEGGAYFTSGSPSGTPYTSSKYTIQEGGEHQIQISLDMTVSIPTYGSASYNLHVLRKNNIVQSSPVFTTIATNTNTFNFQPSTITVSTNTYFWTVPQDQQSEPILGTPTVSAKYITLPDTSQVVQPGTTFYKYRLLWTQVDAVNCSVLNPQTGDYYSLTASELIGTFNSGCNTIVRKTGVKLYKISNLDVPDTTTTKTFKINVPKTYANAGDEYQIFVTQSFAQKPLTASLSQGSLRINSNASGVGNYPYTPLIFSYDMGLPGADKRTLTFTRPATSFYTPNYVYLPKYVSGSLTITSSLYSKYGDAEYPFQLQPYDIFAAYDPNGFYFESRVANVYTASDNTLRVEIEDEMNDTLRENLSDFGNKNNNNAYPSGSFLFLKRVDDETNATLSFKKYPGQTSYGFLLPDNLAPDVLSNIDTIIKQVKQKVISDQSTQ